MERNIDAMKYRESTHLAGLDVETIIAEQGKCYVTIKDVYFDRNVNVSGNKKDAYFIEFVENLKPMVVNSTNRKVITDIVKSNNKLTSTEARNIGNWIGIKIELLFDPNVKMMGKTVGGIRIAPKSPIPDISDENAINILNESKTLDELQDNWKKLSKDEKALPSVNKLAKELKTQLSAK